MGFTLYTITLPESTPLKALQDYIFTNLYKLFFAFHNKYAHKAQQPHDEEDGEVDACCAVCLSSIEGWHKVRELGNCAHAFHVECLDGWADQGQETCPVCRAKLLAGHAHEDEDPWRSERMVYLFGEDCMLSQLD
ncbi:E3 ubiquitin-protein ligase ATL41 [Sesamum angolense]|uniref:E3 ubiquitin-protein ligase ATL41 n=1 Tax=Sesamum angolense TaxID=2727404 RepID=A0AAE1T9M5_9LAMI|nr:E3 ubiquitin-protein ligase ATL41 [Sesamum angolense]